MQSVQDKLVLPFTSRPHLTTLSTCVVQLTEYTIPVLKCVRVFLVEADRIRWEMPLGEENDEGLEVVFGSQDRKLIL